jgi:outer membrane protein OmpA-like peptidoglycan-associated protein
MAPKNALGQQLFPPAHEQVARSSGAGEVALTRVPTYRDSDSPGIGGLLYNFDVNSSELKRTHQLCLEWVVAPYVLAFGWRVYLVGLASMTGTFAHDLHLSRRRAMGVVAHLTLLGVPAGGIVSSGHGRGQLNTAEAESALDRSVLFLVHPRHIDGSAHMWREVELDRATNLLPRLRFVTPPLRSVA